jgi:hypothetical protein
MDENQQTVVLFVGLLNPLENSVLYRKIYQADLKRLSRLPSPTGIVSNA